MATRGVETTLDLLGHEITKGGAAMGLAAGCTR